MIPNRYLIKSIKPIKSCFNFKRMMSSIHYYSGSNGSRLNGPEEFIDELKNSQSQVYLIGENHSDPSKIDIEVNVLKTMLDKFNKEQLTLSLEFWDRGSQAIFNEYLLDLIDKETFLKYSNPPSNYEDYFKLIDYCKENEIKVIGANCSGRYTKMIRQHGQNSFKKLDEISRQLLPTNLDFPPPSQAYKNAFFDIMGIVADNPSNHKIISMLDAQNLWDATMADSIHSEIERGKKVLHISGYFHIQKNLGIVEHLKNLSENTTISTIAIIPEENPERFDSETHLKMGDYVILTDLKNI